METGQLVQQLVKHEGASDGSVLRSNVGRISITREASQSFFSTLKNDFGFDHCSLISAVDNQTAFELVYHFSIVDATGQIDRKSTRLNSSHVVISYAVIRLKKKKIQT